jgi:hypothetical protein
MAARIGFKIPTGKGGQSWMGKPYSNGLRERVVATIDSGHTREEVAELYNLALSTVGRFIRRKRETGSVERANSAGTRHLRLRHTPIWSGRWWPNSRIARWRSLKRGWRKRR